MRYLRLFMLIAALCTAAAVAAAKPSAPAAPPLTSGAWIGHADAASPLYRCLGGWSGGRFDLWSFCVPVTRPATEPKAIPPSRATETTHER